MKKSILFFAALSLMFGFIGLSCKKNLPEPQHELSTQKEAKFEQELLYYLTLMDDQNHLYVQEKDGEIETKIIARKISSSSRAIVCEGSGVSFARCVAQWLDNNPGDCLKIFKRDGTYFADDDC